MHGYNAYNAYNNYSVQPEVYTSPSYGLPSFQNVTVVTQQPGSSLTHGQPQNVRDWSSGLCGCCEDCWSCMYAFFFHPCFMCTLAFRLDEFFCGSFCCCTVFDIPMRTKLRTQYGIQGSILDDCCMITFCNFCATHQMYRELDHLGHK